MKNSAGNFSAVDWKYHFLGSLLKKSKLFVEAEI